MESLLALLMCAALLPPVPAGSGVASGDPVCRNGFYLVHGKDLLRFDETGRRHDTVARLPMPVNAVAYLPGEEILVGIADFHGHSHLITIDRQGRVTDRGNVLKGLRKPIAAAVNEHGLLVGSGDRLLTIDPVTLKIVARVRLSAPADTGDWDVHPADGKLYGLTAGEVPRLIRIDPDTGVVTTVASLPGLPSGGTFGAVAIDVHGNLHALHNRTGRIYHLPIARPDRFAFTESGSSTRQSDAARCPIAWDFGDAPESYARSGDGPRHTITTIGALTIGETVAEDGLSSELTVDAGATSLSVAIAVRNTTGQPALLAGWHDLDGDGAFGATEQTTEVVPAAATRIVLRWPDLAVGDSISRTFLRLRLYGTVPEDIAPDGSASGGEVEDHPIRVLRPPPLPPSLPPIKPEPAPVVPPPSPSPTPSPSASAEPPPSTPDTVAPARVLAPPERPSPRLPITWSLFAGMLVPAITIVARSHVKARSRP